MLYRIGVLLGLTVLVFGTIFLITYDWQGEPPAEAVVEAQAPAQQGSPGQTQDPAQQDAVAEAQAPAQEGTAQEAAEPVPVDESLLTAGQSQYVICQGCHGPTGEGSVGPGFVGNTDLADADFVVETILFGREAMPPFGDRLDDGEVAAVATYIRNSWGNAFGGITPEHVAATREQGASAQ